VDHAEHQAEHSSEFLSSLSLKQKELLAMGGMDQEAIGVGEEDELRVALQWHRSEMVRISRRLNAFAAINARLPVEIFQYIFELHFSNSSHLGLGSFNRYGWIRITHVCHYWREVAIQHPLLWTRLVLPYRGAIPAASDYRTAEVAEMQLRRSANLDLSLSVGPLINAAFQSAGGFVHPIDEMLCGILHRVTSMNVVSYVDTKTLPPLSHQYSPPTPHPYHSVQPAP